MGVRKAWVGMGMDGVRDREGVRDRVYGVRGARGMVEGWVRGGQGLEYGWVVVRVGWVYGVAQEGRDEGRDWGMVGLGYGWLGVRAGVYGVGQEGRDWGMVGLGYGWVRIRVGWRTGWGVWVGQKGRGEGRVDRVGIEVKV